MGSTENRSTGSSPRQIVVLVVSLVVAFVVGFLIMRILPFWLGLVVLVLFVVGARAYKLRKDRSG